MKFVTEKMGDENLSEIFSFIGANHPNKNARVRSDVDGWMPFFKAWSGQDPFHKIKVFTMREESDLEIKGCVVVLATQNPLFVEDPMITRLTEINCNDQFNEYINTVLQGL